MTARAGRFVAVAVLVAGVAVALAAQKSKPPRMTVNEGDTGPVLLHKVMPKYPDGEKLAGTVRIAIVIATDGTVAETQVVAGFEPSHDQEAVKAVRQWKYLPTQFKGEPAEVEMTVVVTFPGK
jgi:TonB family protein